MYENLEVRETIVKPRLSEVMNPTGWTDWATARPDPDELREDVLAVFRRQGYSGGVWLYKDPKLLFMHEAWRLAFPEAVWVKTRRDPDEIAASIRRRWKVEDPEDAVRRALVRLRGLEAFTVWPRDLGRGRTADYEAVCEAAGLEWRDTANAFTERRWHGAVE